MRKSMLLFIAVLAVASCTGCQSAEVSQEPSANEEQVQIANPFIDCDSMEQAAEITGFDLILPENLPNWATSSAIRVMGTEMIEVIYSGEKDQEIRIRKAPGQDDISGCYDSFETTEEITLGDVQVTMKGTGSEINAAAWTDEKYSYSVVGRNGVSKEEITAVVSDIQK